MGHEAELNEEFYSQETKCIDWVRKGSAQSCTRNVPAKKHVVSLHHLGTPLLGSWSC